MKSNRIHTAGRGGLEASSVDLDLEIEEDKMKFYITMEKRRQEGNWEGKNGKSDEN